MSRQSRHDTYNRSRPIKIHRDNSLPSYEEAIANIHHNAYTTSRFDDPSISSDSNIYSREAVYQYAQATRTEVSEASSREQNVDIFIQHQSNPSTDRITQIQLEHERAVGRERKDKIKKFINYTVLAILVFAVVFALIKIFTTLIKNK